MKNLFVIILIGTTTLSAKAQVIEKNLDHFNKVIASPKINLVMVEGKNESIKITYANVDPSKINIVVKNNALHIYLDGSKFTEKKQRVKRDGWVEKQSIFCSASITAYVTYRHLDKLVVRGEQEVDMQSALQNKKFRLKAYGECDITVAAINASKFKATLYGEHKLKISAGSVDFQKYKLFGRNRIDAQAIKGEEITSTTYGESKLKLNAEESLRLVTFGESDVLVNGGANINKLTLGEISVRR